MKNINKVVLIGVASLIITGSLMINYRTQSTDELNLPCIGIIKTISHPALDQTQKAFMDEMKHLTNGKISFIVQDAQGTVSLAHQIAQNFKANTKVNAIYAIATPALQAAANVEHTKPIIYAAVTDPESLGILGLNSNVCGISDMINIPKTIEMLHTLLPQIKKVALLYNPGETNSVMLVEKMKQELLFKGLESIGIGISSANEIRSATLLACAQADAILAPTDNTVATALPTIAQIAHKAHKPLFVSFFAESLHGACAAYGVDYYEQGKQAANYAYKVLIEGEKPGALPLALPSYSTLVLNKTVADKLGIQIPSHLLKIVNFL